MKTDKKLKQLVKENYGKIAKNILEEKTGCCSTSNCVDVSDDYEGLKGYHSDADMGLGCGLPTEFAQIKEGDTVVDLGSGAGNDCFVARSLVGETGKVIGLDMTEAMVDQARKNARKLAYNNVEFVLGDIESMSLQSGIADVVVSNCVLNLIPDKKKALSETYRILKHGGHFSISDIVWQGEELPENMRKEAELYVGCISGAIQKKDYLRLIKQIGFQNIRIQKEKNIHLPNQMLSKQLTDSEIQDFRQRTKMLSITVYADKP